MKGTERNSKKRNDEVIITSITNLNSKERGNERMIDGRKGRKA